LTLAKSVLEIVEQEIRDIKPFKPERIVLCSTPITCTVASEAFKGLSDTPFLIIPTSMDIDSDIYTDFHYFDVQYIAHEEALLWMNISQGLLKPIGDMLNNWMTKRTRIFYLLASLENSFEEAILYQALSYLKQTRADLMKILIVLLPSRVESVSLIFNAYTWLLKVLGDKLADMVLLFEREKVENYEAISIHGEPLKGLTTLSYALRLIVKRDLDLLGYFKSTTKFDLNAHIPLLSLGHNLAIYDNIQNVLTASTCRPLVNFNALRAKTMYMIPEIPINLKNKLTMEELRKGLSKWIEKIGLSPLFWDVSEPIVKDVETTRISIVGALGGIDLKPALSNIAKGYAEFKEIALVQEMINKDYLESIQKLEKEVID